MGLENTYEMEFNSADMRQKTVDYFNTLDLGEVLEMKHDVLYFLALQLNDEDAIAKWEQLFQEWISNPNNWENANVQSTSDQAQKTKPKAKRTTKRRRQTTKKKVDSAE